MAKDKKKPAPKKKSDSGNAGGAVKASDRKKGKLKGGTVQKITFEEGKPKVSPKVVKPGFQKKYEEEIVPQLMKEFDFKNKMNVPRIEKVAINCAVKDAVANPKVLDAAFDELMLIAGQKPVTTRARKSIASFKLREGMPLGVAVTLRRARMYEFLERLIKVALPRVRDFKGVSAKLDGRGNYSLGLKEQIIFPEINYDKVDKIKGLTVTITTSAKTNEQGKALLAGLGMPFKK